MQQLLADHRLPAETQHLPIGVVDDAGPDRQLLTEALAEAGGFDQIQCYASADEALAGFSIFRPALVFMDIRMPGMSGIDCTRVVKQRAPATKIVMLTGFGDDALMRN